MTLYPTAFVLMSRFTGNGRSLKWANPLGGTAVTTTLTLLFLVIGILTTCGGVVAAEPTYAFSSRRTPGDVDLVKVLFEVGGNVSDVVDGKIHSEPMRVVCKLAYDERTLGVAGSADLMTIRHYNEATAAMEFGSEKVATTLGPERRLIMAVADADTTTLYSPKGALTREELELIDVHGNSLLLDRLLPSKAVAVNASWKHPARLMALLLGLDEVAETDVQSTLVEVNDTAAQFEMAGRVSGGVEGVSTDIEIKGRYRFDRRTQRIDWFAMVVKEKRGSSPVADAVDVSARLQATIRPQAAIGMLDEAALQGLTLEPNAARQQLVIASPEGTWQLTHDRHWHLFGNRPKIAILRLIDRGELVAQCNLSPLDKLVAGQQVELATFQENVRRALGEDFGRFVEAGQRANDADYRVYRVAVDGVVQDDVAKKNVALPVRWIYYLVMDGQGRRTAFTFTVEAGLVEQFAKADIRLVDAFRFREPQMAVKDVQ